MSARIIDGREIAARVRRQVAADVSRLQADTGRAPGLATILVGEDPASTVYVANKRKASAEVGIADLHQHLPAESSEQEVAATIQQCNDDPRVNGILLQLPLPAGLDAARLTALISPQKDVDGLTPISAGRLLHGSPGLAPCTPLGIIELLDSEAVQLAGARAVIVGRSNLVGKPLYLLLLARNATVTLCHSRTRDLAGVCVQADVLVAAAGSAGLIGPQHTKAGAVVIDVGINRTQDGLLGDVQFDAVAQRAAAITPVPGGVGPMTIAMLLRNTVSAMLLQEPLAQ